MILLIQACLDDHIVVASFVKLHNVFENSRCVVLLSHELRGLPARKGYTQFILQEICFHSITCDTDIHTTV
jgi:hypothetical protein